MKTKKLTALILSILMIVMMLPTSVFAAPAAVTVADTIHDHAHSHADIYSVLSSDAQIVIEMADLSQDGWDGDAAIEIFQNGVSIGTAKLQTGAAATWSAEYDSLAGYTFAWITGTYDEECSFDIIISGETVYSAAEGDCSSLENGKVFLEIEPKCDHSIEGVGKLCSVCGNVCGEQFSHNIGDNNTCTVCGFVCGITKDHDWSNKDGVCTVCLYECSSHEFDENNTCTVCGYVSYIVINMFDGYGDGWNYNAVEIFKDGVHVGTATIDDESASSASFNIVYDSKSTYTFTWTLGSYGEECSFDIIVGGKTVFSASSNDCAIYEDGQLIYKMEYVCNHSVSAPGQPCSECGNVCGEQFSHNIGDNNTCTVCGFVCGTTKDHDWTNRDGVCAVCSYECTGHIYDENYSCITCSYMKKASVTSADGTETAVFEALEDAIEAARLLEGSVVTLLDSVRLDSAIPTVSGRFTIDLNGNTLNSISSRALYVNGTSDIKIIDSSEDMTGVILSSDPACPAIDLIDSAQLEIAGGKVESGGVAIDMSDSGSRTSSVLKLSGGRLVSSDSVNAYGNSVIVTGGVLKRINYLSGTIDLSGHPDPSGITIYNNIFDNMSEFDVKLSENYGLFDSDGAELITPEMYETYTVKFTKQAEWGESAEALSFAGSLDEAITAAESDSGVKYIKLRNDVTSDAVAAADVNGGEFTLDLNGHTISCTSTATWSYALRISGNAAVKVVDTSEVKGKIQGQSVGISIGYGKCDIDGVTVNGDIHGVTVGTNNTFTASNDSVITGGIYGISTNGYAEITSTEVTGGTSALFASSNNAKLKVNGMSRLYGTDRDIELQSGGKADLTGYANSQESITFYNNTGSDITVGSETLIISDRYEVLDSAGTALTTLPNAGIFTISKKQGYDIEIDLGARADDTNIRYAEINGAVYEISESNDKYYVAVGEENLLVEIVEKSSADTAEIVKSQYFYINMSEKSAIKLYMDSYMQSYDETSIRTNNPMGIRFKSVVTTVSKLEDVEFVIDEYGFVVAKEDDLGETELTLDFSKYVTGVAYNKENGTDIIFDASNDDYHVFAGYVKNVPVANYKTNLVCKTYTKLTVNDKQYVVYGEAVTGNIYDTANALLADETLDTVTKEALTQIVLDYENTLGLPGDGLYPEA